MRSEFNRGEFLINNLMHKFGRFEFRGDWRVYRIFNRESNGVRRAGRDDAAVISRAVAEWLEPFFALREHSSTLQPLTLASSSQLLMHFLTSLLSNTSQRVA